MPDTVTNELIYETLKKIQDSVADIRNGQVDLRRDMRDLKESQIGTRDEIQGLRRDMLLYGAVQIQATRRRKNRPPRRSLASNVCH